MIFTIPGELTDLNTYISAERSNRFKGASVKKSQMNIVSGCILEARLKPVKTSVYITYRFYCKNKRKDKSNVSNYAIKVIEDALVNNRIIPNDGWDDIEGFHSEFYIDKNKPRIEVEIV